MPEEQAANVTPADILAVGEKLEQLCAELPPGQRAAVALLLQRAALAQSEESGVQGYAVVFQRLADAARGSQAGFEFETTWALETQPS